LLLLWVLALLILLLIRLLLVLPVGLVLAMLAILWRMGGLAVLGVGIGLVLVVRGWLLRARRRDSVPWRGEDSA